MSCLQFTDYSRGCDNSQGGIKTVVLFELSSGSSYTLSADNELTGYTMASDVDAYKFDFLKDNSNITDAIIGDGVGANISFQPTVNLIFKKNSKELLNNIMEMGKNYLVAIVEDNNGLYWTLGIERGLQVIAGAGASSGNLLTDPNNYTVILQGNEKLTMLETDISAGSSIDSKILDKFGF